MKIIVLALALSGFVGCMTDTGSGESSGGVVVGALSSGADGANSVVFVMLEGHRACPGIAAYRAGEAFDVRGARIGNAVVVNLRDGLADTGGGGHQISEDAFFDDVAIGPFTICAHLLDDLGACLNGCSTAGAFGNATAAHKAHVTLVMTCNTPPTQDVGSILEVQSTPIVNLTAAMETGLVACGDRTDGDRLSIAAAIESPDGTQGEFMVNVLAHADSVTVTPPAGAWYPAGSGFLVSFLNTTGEPLSVPISISGRTPALDGGYLSAPDYTLTLEWLACE